MNLFVTGIGTDVGKTVASALLVEALRADYWKPIQAGLDGGGDAQRVRQLVANTQSTFWPSRYNLQLPASPHFAAAAENVHIQLSDFQLPQTQNNLVVEGAGGLMVPINRQNLVIDLIATLKLPTILVANNYLGSINHTILSIQALQQKNIPILALLYNGQPYNDNQDIITQITKVPTLFTLPQAPNLNSQWISQQAQILRANPLFISLFGDFL